MRETLLHDYRLYNSKLRKVVKYVTLVWFQSQHHWNLVLGINEASKL